MERSNLSLRMGIRRFTRLANGFSKKWENLGPLSLSGLRFITSAVHTSHFASLLRWRQAFLIMYGQFGSCWCNDLLLYCGMYMIKDLLDDVLRLEGTIWRDHLNRAEPHAKHIPFVKTNLPSI